MQRQVGEPGGGRDRRQRVYAKQPSIAVATKGEVSASSDGWRQDEGGLGPKSTVATGGLNLKVRLCQRSAPVDGVAQAFHERVGDTFVVKYPD